MLLSNEDLRDYVSKDPYAGTVDENGKLIVDAETAGYNLSRTNQQWDINNYGVMTDGVLNFGFWDLDSLLTSYYVNKTGTIAFNEAYYQDAFVPFSEQQKDLAREAIGMWDDLINIKIQETDIHNADITFGNTDDGPGSGAYAYLPFGSGLDAAYKAAYGFEQVGRLGGDVWINTQETANFQNFDKGYYANFAITHELGHALGLSHAGQYNATNPDGSVNNPDYAGDAYFYQDSNQYTIMSYFGAEETGGMWIDFRTLTYGYAATPMVHDIVAVQQIYGADMTTRTGDTTYGFNSNADRDAFHIDGDNTFLPIFTIWDAGGNDTLDLSGYNTPSIIDLNPGAFSSAGGTVQMTYSLDEINAARTELGRAAATQATLDFYTAYAAQYGITDGLYKDNIAIAYGVTVENAIGGGGNDTITGNSANNLIIGNGGNDAINGGAGIDTASYATATGGVTVSLLAGTATGAAGNDTLALVENVIGSGFADRITGDAGTNEIRAGKGLDVVTLGGGADTYIADLGTRSSSKVGNISWDIVTDFTKGVDKIDLSELGQDTFNFRGTGANKLDGDVSYKVYDSMNGAEKALGLDIHSHATGSGPVTVVFVDTDGVAGADMGIILLNQNGIAGTDFIYG